MVELLERYGIAFVAVSVACWCRAAPACLSAKPRLARWNRSSALRLYLALLAGGAALVALLELLVRTAR
jgi:hypothetical protein